MSPYGYLYCLVAGTRDFGAKGFGTNKLFHSSISKTPGRLQTQMKSVSANSAESLRPTRPFFLRPVYYFGIWTFLAVLFGFQEYRTNKLYDSNFVLCRSLLVYLVQFYVWAFLYLLLWKLMRYVPLERRTWKRNVLFHFVFAWIVAVGELALYVVCIQLTGTTKKPFTKLFLLNLNTDAATNFFTYWVFIGLYCGIGYYEKYRTRELRAAELKTELAQSQLQLLKAQLNPHFLFNTMNSIASLMHKDVEAADAMLGGLSSLLRLALERGNDQETTLQQELEFIEQYLDIQRVRFGSRLVVESHIQPKLLDAAVPSMILQPVVENAIVHGVAKTASPVRLEISAVERDGKLYISVFNEGSILKQDFTDASLGVGLRNSVTRLSYMYADKQSFKLMNRPGGGVEALMVLPFAPFLNLKRQNDGTIYADSHDRY